MPVKILKQADITLTLAQAKALLVIVNSVLTDGDNRLEHGTQAAATHACQRIIESFNGQWQMKAGGVASNLWG